MLAVRKTHLSRRNQEASGYGGEGRRATLPSQQPRDPFPQGQAARDPFSPSASATLSGILGLERSAKENSTPPPLCMCTWQLSSSFWVKTLPPVAARPVPRTSKPHQLPSCPLATCKSFLCINISGYPRTTLDSRNPLNAVKLVLLCRFNNSSFDRILGLFAPKFMGSFFGLSDCPLESPSPFFPERPGVTGKGRGGAPSPSYSRAVLKDGPNRKPEANKMQR